VGADGPLRATLDWNQLLDQDDGIALRLNAKFHQADEPGRDVERNECCGFARWMALGLGSDAQRTLSYLHQKQNDWPGLGLPNARNAKLAGFGFQGAAAPVDRFQFYRYCTDYRDIEADIATARLEHPTKRDRCGDRRVG